MERSFEPEILENPALPDTVVERAHRDLTRTHRWLGNTGAIVNALRRHKHPVRRVLDVGCGYGGILAEIRSRLGVDVIGVDLRAPRRNSAKVPILAADAVRQPLPEADVAISLCLAHHLADWELVELVRNVGRSCPRFVLLDLVRHPLPMVLFASLVTPFVSTVNARDGLSSIRRSYTPAELHSIVRGALEGSRARFYHSVSPIYSRQIVDIRYRE